MGTRSLSQPDPSEERLGKHNSSRTRVAPVFESLLSKDRSGRSWLVPLMQLGSRSSAAQIPVDGGLIENHESWWGTNERRLKPHPALLRWLAQNFERGTGGRETSEATHENRQKLLDRDPATITQALQLLATSGTPGKWYVLEGFSQPDAYLEADDFVLVIEGKRAERGQTTATSWMANRNQMLRHMDAAAWNAPKGKRVFGLMIVEGEASGDGMTASDEWVKGCDAIRSDAVTNRSLPHLSAAERRTLVDGFLGVTTWQRICHTFKLPWPPVEENS